MITEYDGSACDVYLRQRLPGGPVRVMLQIPGSGRASRPAATPARDRLSAGPAGLGGLSNVDGAYVDVTRCSRCGDLAGESRLIAGYEAATHTFELGLPSQRPSVGDAFDIIVGTGSSAVMPGVQVYVGTLDGSDLLSTMAGTPTSNPTAPLPVGERPQPRSGPPAVAPERLGSGVGPQGLMLDLVANSGIFSGGMFDGMTMPIPSVQFREPGTHLGSRSRFTPRARSTTHRLADTRGVRRRQ